MQSVKTAGSALGILLAWAAAAQAPPGTEIHRARIDGCSLDAPERLTDRPGYDNQPRFQPDGRAFWFTRFETDHTDIHSYDLATGRTVAVTRSPLSEYSPTPRPGGGFTVVRVEADGRQRLWHFGRDGTAGKLLFPHFEPVGYFDWLDRDHVAAFILGEPPTLQVIGPSGMGRTVAGEIGRAIRRLPDGRIAYVDKSVQPFEIVALRAPDGESVQLAQTVGHGEDFTVGPDGTLWMGNGSEIHCRSAHVWIEAADFSTQGIHGISRLAVSPDGKWLLFVAEE